MELQSLIAIIASILFNRVINNHKRHDERSVLTAPSENFVMTKKDPVDWLATLKLGFARGIASTAVIAAISASGLHILERPEMLWLWPPIAVISTTACHYLWKGFGAVLSLIAKTVVGRDEIIFDAMTNVMLFCISLIIACGDPIVYILNKIFPSLLGLSTFNFVNFVPLMIVSKPIPTSRAPHAIGI